MNVLGVKITKHDTGAALISDQRIVAIAEERLNRVKHSPNMFPHLSIEYCLDVLAISPEDVDLVVIDQTDHRDKVSMEKIFLEETKGKFNRAEVNVINHHDAHAASAFFASPFSEAAILIYDGTGEKFITHHGIYAVETETLYYGIENKFHQIQKTLHRREKKIFPYSFGIGKLYNYLSEFYLGFGSYNEGKMMGLAAYGDNRILREIPEEEWCKEYNGHIVCNSRITFPRGNSLSILKEKTGLSLFRRVRRKILFITAEISKHLFERVNRHVFANPHIFSEIRLAKPRRNPKDPLPEPYYSSVAYTGQYILERAAYLWGKKLKGITQSENLCVAGGVGLNIDANKNFLNKVGFSKLFVQPGASDTGVPLGCALYGWHVIKEQPRFFNMQSASLGREYGSDEILSALENEGEKISFRKTSNVAEDTAKLIAEGNIIGWFHGGAEYGPRSLGNRSILCDARRKDMKDIVNKKVKGRESWRPFATSILREHVSEYFELDVDTPFMLLDAKVRKDKKDEIPAVLHVDDTSRLQSVVPENNRRYHDLLTSFYKETKVPLFLNTSFNLGGDPIVETPKDALDTFLKTNMDYLVLENYIVSKKK